MGNEYKSWYMKDLIPIIEHTALDIMGDPILYVRKNNGTVMTPAEVASHNSLIAMHNDGIRELAHTLIVTLAKDGDDDG